MLVSLLPDCAVAVVFGDDEAPGTLYPDEAVAVAGAVEKRRREFTLGRQCARQALARLAAPVGSIPVGADRAPVWPPGVIGSITHCRSYVAAAVAWSRDLGGLGIDAEPAEELTPGIVDLIAVAEERDWLAARIDGVPWTTILFSAKESVYKCVFPRARLLLDFLDVALELRPDGTFTASSQRLDLSRVHGRWGVSATHVLTTATLP